MTVFDASALLVFIHGEVGEEVVGARLSDGGSCSAANWSEVAQKVLQAGADWPLVRETLLSFPLTIEPVLREDAERAAALWRRGAGLSLGDRLCLALGHRLDAEVLTADRAWEEHPQVVVVR